MTMDEKFYSITLSDGTVIDNLILNGNNFISKEEITEDIFTGNLSKVSINDGENIQEGNGLSLIHLTYHPETNEYWFALREITTDELEKMQLSADIEYLAMMTGVEL